MLVSRLAKSGRSLSVAKGLHYCNPFVKSASILKFPVVTIPTHQYQCFSTTVESNEEGVDTSSHKQLIESRSEESDKKVKKYLSLINTCALRKHYFVERTRELMDENTFLYPGELSSCISYMYRIGLTKLALQLFRYYDKNDVFGLLNVNSLKYIMLCCVKEKDSKLLYHVYNSLNSKRKNSIVLNSTYIRCLLSLNDLSLATTLLQTYLTNPVYKNTTVLSKNDIYSNVVVGFYEGGYYSRCLKAFHSLRPEDGIESQQLSEVGEANWKSVQNSLCYSAVIGSYFRTSQYSSVLAYYNECRKLRLFPSFHEAMMVAECHLFSDEYKLVYDELNSKKMAFRGIPESEKERYIANLSKVNQMRKALRQVYWNWHYYRNQKPKLDQHTKSISVYTGDNDDVGSCLQVLATFYDLKGISSQDLNNVNIVVKTGANKISLQQVIDFLDNDLYPILPYEIDVNRIVMKVSDVQKWVKTRRSISLELR